MARADGRAARTVALTSDALPLADVFGPRQREPARGGAGLLDHASDCVGKDVAEHVSRRSQIARCSTIQRSTARIGPGSSRQVRTRPVFSSRWARACRGAATRSVATRPARPRAHSPRRRHGWPRDDPAAVGVGQTVERPDRGELCRAMRRVSRANAGQAVHRFHRICLSFACLVTKQPKSAAIGDGGEAPSSGRGARDYETAVARLVSSRARMMGEAGQHYAFGELVVAALARAVLARVAQASELLGAAGHAARVRLRHEPPYVSASVERTSGLRSRGLGERESQRCYAVGEWWRIAEGFDRANFRGADTAACSRPLGMAGGEPSATPVRSRVGWQWRSHP